jgi:hypothetical protein
MKEISSYLLRYQTSGYEQATERGGETAPNTQDQTLLKLISLLQKQS